MSGPKSSRYTLTPEQLKIILEEQARLRRELEERARKERESKEARAYLKTVKTQAQSYSAMIVDYERRVKSEKTSSDFNAFFMKIGELNTLCSPVKNADHASIMHAKEKAKSLLTEIAIEGEALVTKCKDIILEERIKTDASIAKGMHVSFVSVGEVETTEEDPEVVKTIAKLDKAYGLDLSPELRTEVSEAISEYKAFEDHGARSNYVAISINPLLKRCAAYDHFAKAKSQEFYAALDKYKALCIQLNEEVKAFPFSAEGLLELEKTVEEYEIQVQQSAEQSYISQSIDEVMIEMGYEVIGHRQVRKKSGKEFRSKLLTYEDGTVVNVTESSTGQITMEIGGMDGTDRLPDANERIALQKKMVSFCKDFKEIERRLATRGVVLDHRLSMAPPEEAYAQIINYTDYELTDNAQLSIAKKQKTGQSSSKKQLRGEEG